MFKSAMRYLRVDRIRTSLRARAASKTSRCRLTVSPYGMCSGLANGLRTSSFLPWCSNVNAVDARGVDGACDTWGSENGYPGRAGSAL